MTVLGFLSGVVAGVLIAGILVVYWLDQYFGGPGRRQ